MSMFPNRGTAPSHSRRVGHPRIVYLTLFVGGLSMLIALDSSIGRSSGGAWAAAPNWLPGTQGASERKSSLPVTPGATEAMLSSFAETATVATAKRPKASPAHLASGDSPALYSCGMHPQVMQREPGTCPICGMDLVAIPDRTARPAHGGTVGHSGVVRVSPGFRQNFAVRTAVVQRGPLTVSIRTLGVLDHDEAKLVSINTKFSGWIEKARINNVGESVVRGDVLFEIYSPEVVTTQREYLATVDYVDRLRASGAHRDALVRAESLLGAARERLRNWDVSETDIGALDAARMVPRTVRVLAPASGIVVDKTGDFLEGMRVSPGRTVIKIADHSTLWAKTDFFDEDLRHVREGNSVVIEAAAFPDRRWEGRILFFRSAVNPETRALTAFVEVANPDLVLRPMMDVTVSARVPVAADAVLAPTESVLRSGERALVVVARGEGLFEPREVALGTAAGNLQQVTAGLAPGERVVVSSQFLIDSESNLQAAVAQLLAEGERADGTSGAPERPHRH